MMLCLNGFWETWRYFTKNHCIVATILKRFGQSSGYDPSVDPQENPTWLRNTSDSFVETCRALLMYRDPQGRCAALLAEEGGTGCRRVTVWMWSWRVDEKIVIDSQRIQWTSMNYCTSNYFHDLPRWFLFLFCFILSYYHNRLRL